MGLGPIPATRKVLQRARLSIKDMDLIELNEAFAVQVLQCVRELEIDEEKLNINGGAVALGGPPPCKGPRALGGLPPPPERRGGRGRPAATGIRGGRRGATRH